MARRFFQKWIALGVQRSNDLAGGPIGPGLDAMSELGAMGRPISPVGLALSRLIRGRGVWVLFFPTGGDGVAPWSGFVIYDVKCRGEGQKASSSRIGLVAHELTHVLQRDRNHDHYWPSGFFRPSRFTRWVTDSTNYMEVLAYIVGWAVEYDMEMKRRQSPELSISEIKKIQRTISDIEHAMATFTGKDERNATRYVLKKHHTNWSYKQNYRKEHTTDDGRIPLGGWDTWLIRFGFTHEAVDHIRAIAKRGTVVPVDADETDKIADVEGLYGGRRREITRKFIGLAKQEMARRFNQSLGVISIFVVLYMIAHYFLSPLISDHSRLVQYAYAGVQWIWWVGIGAAVATVSSRASTIRDPSSRYIPPDFDWRGLLFVGISTSILFVLVLRWQTTLTLDLSMAFATIELEGFQIVSLPLIAFAVGFFYQLLANFVEIVMNSCKEGFIAPLFQLLRRIISKRETEEMGR